MRRAWLFVFALGCGGAPDAPTSAPTTVVIVSLDGFRHDYPARTDTPAFDRLAREGARAERLTPVFPSQTFPAHATLATGVRAQAHGIMNNRFFDTARGPFSYDDEADWYDHVPLWAHAEQHGVRAHVFHWIGSNGAWRGAAASEARLFDPAIDDDTKVDTVLTWLRAPAAERPRLVMSYFAGCDKKGHELGPDHPEVSACVAATDARLGRLLDGLAGLGRPVALLVVSDHGMMKTRGEIDVRGALADHDVEVHASGPIAQIHATEGTDRAAVAATLARLEHVTVHRREDIPAALAYTHPTRSGDWLLVCDYGWHFHGSASKSRIMLAGHHGHDPSKPEMGAIFYAWGEGVRPGARLAEVEGVDLVPIAAALLGIPAPEGVEGVVPSGLLTRR